MRRPTLPTALLYGAAALLLLGWGVRLLKQVPEDDVPPIDIVFPTAADTVRDSLVVRFRTTAPLALTSRGWSAGPLHPHLLLDGTEHMAGSGDIAADGEAFRWRLPLPDPGPHTLRAGWAGPDHRARGEPGRLIRFTSR